MAEPLSPNLDPNVVHNIVDEILSEKIILFLGAGLSMGSGLPGWRELTHQLANDIGCDSSLDPLTVAHQYELARGRPALIEKVKSLTDTVGKHPSKIHELLPDLRVNTWITTNYDDLLEATLKQKCRPFEVICRSCQIPTCDWRKTVLIKLHGDRNNPDLIVATEK